MSLYLRLLFAALIVLVGAITGTTAWVLYTPGGLAWGTRQIERIMGAGLALEYETGTLGSGATFTHIRYEAKPVSLTARRVFIRVSPRSLLSMSPHISQLHAERIDLAVAPTEKSAHNLEVPALPIGLRIDEARVGTFVIQQGDTKTELKKVSLRYEGGLLSHQIRDLHVTLNGLDVAANATVSTRDPFKVDADASVTQESTKPRLVVRLTAGGNLAHLALNASAESARARLNVNAEMVPAAENPVERLRGHLDDLNLHEFNESLPETELSGDISLQAEGAVLAGTTRFTNALRGAYDEGRLPVALLRSTVRTDFSRADFADLLVDLGPGGRLAGSGQYEGQRLTLALATRDLDLHGVYLQLRKTSLAGHATAELMPDQQSINAEFKEGQMHLRLGAERTGDLVKLDATVAQPQGGGASAKGMITLTGQMPYSAHATFTGFNPAAWGEFAHGALNGNFSAQGMAEESQAEVRLVLERSRLLNAPLVGRGRFAVAKARIFDAAVDLRLGRNHLSANGAFGRPDDKMHLRIDAPRLTTFDSRLNGGVRGDVQLSGTLNAPVASFQASADGFRFADRAVIGRARANGVYSSGPSTPLRVSLEASEVAAEGRRLDSIAFELHGSRAAHDALLRAAGPDFQLLARARGALASSHVWSGTMLEMTNRGQFAFALDSPVKFTVGPKLADIEAFGAQIMGGHLNADRTHYAAGVLSTAGRFSRIPGSAVAIAAGAPSTMGGTVRLSGSWSVTAKETLTGSFSVKRDSGDIALGRNGGTPLRLQRFAAEGHLSADRLDFRATLAAALANAQAEGSIATVATDEGPRITKKSSVRFTSKFAVAKLSAFAALADANVLFDGRINANVAGRGTLGEPVLSGEIAADRLELALPPQGLDLRDGVLRAALTDGGLRVDSFQMRGGDGTLHANGHLAFHGKNGSQLDWQADRLLLLGRPDRWLVVSGKGRAALVGQKLSLSGKLRADKGRFEIREEELPTLGSDVIVTGREQPAPEGSRLAGAAIKLALDFGKDLRVTGRGLDAVLAGQIEVTSEGGALHANGTVQTERGTYTAFGQRLDIERGKLIFASSLDNPGLDIIAMRRKQAVEAGVAVTGTVRAPFVRIVSDPPVPENEAIAWLVLGHGPAEASRGDLAMLPLAAGALLGNNGSSGDSLEKRLGLDNIGLRGAGTEKQYVTLGKRISDRLYVGYEQGLGAALSILKLEFNLTQRWLMRAQTGETSALGLFFRYAFD